MKTVYRILLAIIGTTTATQLYAQDIHLSQFYETPILRNPALIGIFNGDVRVQAVYRNQWNSVTIPYQTGTLSGEIKFPVGRSNDYVTTGLQLTYDRAGTSKLQSTQIFPAINYHKSLNEDKSSFLSLGFMGGYVQRQFDPSNMTFNNQYTNGRFDPAMPTGEEGKLAFKGYSYLDMGVGLSYNGVIREDVNYFIGAGYFHFNGAKISFYNDQNIALQPKITFNAGITIPVDERVKVIAHYNQLHQGTYSEYIGGALIGYGLMNQGLESTRAIYGGMFLRWNDAIIPTIKIDMDKYEVAMSYDTNISQLRTASQTFGGFEISLVFKGFLNSRNSTLESLNCPRF
ncbi:PorP/SprF family type IX secretion system membrane protein [Chitinophaga polysaccharea]|uniref:PorP/SprF family type IX secretion system membrane protein n=1 Tax=Chitinophaga TaxID=79328 RepID=UPI0014556CB3|nr:MULTISPECIES: PorP/SprF family type IX secretion system membrane protein [Chitinophaga]NLR56731.1 PorP/SprF family type IX secretion system membrane protein [Chitinophaga polysaccharea]NLU92959.1 PorP/SprF family type IX secretion system membrane protein [Chitinophaga sp. Ak27]